LTVLSKFQGEKLFIGSKYNFCEAYPRFLLSLTPAFTISAYYIGRKDGNDAKSNRFS
jgi:hypothetical protein